jgi:hypothetical protein
MKLSKTIFLSILFLFVLLLCSCKKCKEFDDFPEFDDLNGISGAVEINTSILFEDIADSYIIRNDSVYQLLIYKTKEDSCVYCNFPSIDFEQYDLIGKATNSINNLKKVVKTNDQTYTYILKKETDSHTTARNDFSMNWMLIPKIAKTDTVIFKFYLFGCK